MVVEAGVGDGGGGGEIRRRHNLMAAGALLVGLALAGGLGLLAVNGLLGLTDDLTRVVVPGSTRVEFADSGDYTIFYEHRSTVDGRTFDTAETLNELRVSIRDVEADSFVPLRSPGSDVEYSFGGRSGRSVLAFTLERPGTYEVTGFYADGSESPEVVLAFGQGVGRTLVLSIIAGIAAFAALVLGAGGALALFFIGRSRAQKAQDAARAARYA